MYVKYKNDHVQNGRRVATLSVFYLNISGILILSLKSTKKDNSNVPKSIKKDKNGLNH